MPTAIKSNDRGAIERALRSNSDVFRHCGIAVAASNVEHDAINGVRALVALDATYRVLLDDRYVVRLADAAQFVAERRTQSWTGLRLMEEYFAWQGRPAWFVDQDWPIEWAWFETAVRDAEAFANAGNTDAISVLTEIARYEVLRENAA